MLQELPVPEAGVDVELAGGGVVVQREHGLLLHVLAEGPAAQRQPAVGVVEVGEAGQVLVHPGYELAEEGARQEGVLRGELVVSGLEVCLFSVCNGAFRRYSTSCKSIIH